MTLLGALLAATAASALVLALRGPTRVERLLGRGIRGATTGSMRVARIIASTPDGVVADGPGVSSGALALTKLVAAGAGALAGCLLALVLGAGPLPIVLCAYAAYIAPSIVADRRTASRRREAERASVILVERLHALVSSGRPVETALIALAERAGGSGLVDAVLRATRRDYLLGAPIHAALEVHARAAGVDALARLAERVDRTRTLGRGAVTMLADLRDDIREAERRRRLADASQVEGKLTLVLTLCYLPALALLVVIPLFLTLLAGLSS